jgi:[acyl-carrier-protein] S-malonyltransferase
MSAHLPEPCSLGLLFAGQGGQYVGMGHNLVHLSPCVRHTLEEADEALGFSISRLMADGPEELLTQTALAQPAILAVGIAQWRVLEQLRPGMVPVMGAGHSLGEYGALVIAGSLEFRDAVRLVHLRGRAMQEAVPIGSGAMAAILGLDGEVVAGLCSRVAEDQVLEIAGLNCPGQVTVAGHREAVRRILPAAEAAGAYFVQILNVSAPFHCRLLQPAADRLAHALSIVRLGPARFPVLQNVCAEASTDPDAIRARLVEQVTRPVLFERTLRRMLQRGVDRFVEVGPGRNLAGMLRHVDRKAFVVCLDRKDGWDQLLSL